MGIIEHSVVKKNKVLLSDYDYKRDIENRLMLSRFTEVEFAVLEEVLYSPIRSSSSKIAQNTNLSEDEVLNILRKIAATRLISFEEGHSVVIDKEARKYFEVEAERFEADFRPGMEFLQHLLKKVPIHVLPQWYAISRTSDNIFESIVEKYLQTPQIFQRHLLDLNFPDPTLSAIAQDVLKAPHFEVSAKEIQEKYNLSSDQFQEAILHLEFHFICTVIYRKKDTHWEGVVTLFQEWQEYLSFLRETTPTSVVDCAKVQRYRPSDFSFVDDLATLLRQEPLACDNEYRQRLLEKIEEFGLSRAETTFEWLKLSSENRALYIHRHYSNHTLIQEKNIREVERALSRILHLGWVDLSDFLKGIHVPVNDGQPVTLRKTGKSWKYQRPLYGVAEVELIQSILFGPLFESGIIAYGSLDCCVRISVTPFGQSLLG